MIQEFLFPRIYAQFRHYCGDPPAPTTTESTAEMMQAFTKYFPDLAKATAKEVLPTGEAQLAAQEVLSPREAALTTKLYEQFGPQINKIGSDIAADNAKRQSQSDLEILQSTGPQVVAAARSAQEQADPEYFKARSDTLGQLGRLFNSLDDPNAGLSGAERAEIDRSLARSNAARGIESPTALSTVERGMTFGQAGEARKQAKQMAIGQAINTATQFLPASKSNVDAFQLTTGKPAVVNTGENRLGGLSQAGNQAFGMGSDMWGGLGQLKGQEMQINSQRRDGLDRALQIQDSASKMIGAANPCCYTLLEAYLGTMPWWVRACRDRFITPERRRGYVWMSSWLVPLMIRFQTVRQLVIESMVAPLTAYGGWYYSVPGYEDGAKYLRTTQRWFKIWDFIGRRVSK